MGRRKKENPEVELRDDEVVRLCDAMGAIPDQREEKNPVYSLAIMLTMLIYSTLCGNVGATGAARYCKSHTDYFQRVFSLKGTPSAVTFSKVIKCVNEESVAEAMSSWIDTCSPDIMERYIALCARRAYEKAESEAIEKMEIELRDKEVNSLSEALSKIPDYRKARGIRYPIIALIVMMIYSVLCGHSKDEEMEEYCWNHRDYFTKMFDLEETPSRDTFRRVKTYLNPSKVAIPLTAWIKTCFPDTKERYNDLFLLHLDGKALRGATEKQNGEPAPYLFNMMYEGESIGLIMKKIGKKKNETGEAVDFLDALNLNGTIVTADSALTTEPVINKIIGSGGQYVLPIKGNQGKTEEKITKMCNKLVSEPSDNSDPNTGNKFAECDHITYRPKREHGREEVITCTLLDTKTVLGELLEEKPFLRSAAHVAVIDKEITKIENGVEVKSKTRRIFIVSLKDVTPEDVRKIVAAHWHIEMQHWLLDVQLDEDRMTSRTGYAMEFGAMLRRLVLVLWKCCQSLNTGKWSRRDKKTLSAFLMRNQSSIQNIEQLLGTCAASSCLAI